MRETTVPVIFTYPKERMVPLVYENYFIARDLIVAGLRHASSNFGANDDYYKDFDDFSLFFSLPGQQMCELKNG